MADFVFNIAKGRVAQYAQNVEDNSPTGCELVVIAYNSSATDDAMNNADTISALEATANVAEVTNTGYSRQDVVAAGITITVDDTGNTVDVDISDQTFTSVSAGTAWTDLVIAYDPTGSSADTALIPLTCHDFAVTPDGNDIVAQIHANGIFRAS